MFRYFKSGIKDSFLVSDLAHLTHDCSLSVLAITSLVGISDCICVCACVFQSRNANEIRQFVPDKIGRYGYRSMGVGFMAWAQPQPSSREFVPLHRFWSSSRGDHVYDVSKDGTCVWDDFSCLSGG